LVFIIELGEGFSGKKGRGFWVFMVRDDWRWA